MDRNRRRPPIGKREERSLILHAGPPECSKSCVKFVSFILIHCAILVRYHNLVVGIGATNAVPNTDSAMLHGQRPQGGKNDTTLSRVNRMNQGKIQGPFFGCFLCIPFHSNKHMSKRPRNATTMHKIYDRPTSVSSVFYHCFGITKIITTYHSHRPTDRQGGNGTILDRFEPQELSSRSFSFVSSLILR